MQTLIEFLAAKGGPKPRPQQLGRATEWLPFCEFTLQSGKLCVCDPAFAPPEADMEVTLRLAPGQYLAEGIGIAFGSDRRVAALRCVRANCKGKTMKAGKRVGEVGVDTGRIGFCDANLFAKSAADLGEDAFADLLDNAPEDAGILDAGKGALLPFVSSGFGDGAFEVIELRAGKTLAGFQVTLIADKAKYPFGKPASEKKPPARQGAKQSASSQTFDLMQQMLSKLQQKRTGDKAKDRETLKGIMDEMIQEQEASLRPQVEEYRAHLVALRQATPLLRTETRPATNEVLSRPEVAARRKGLEKGGYRLQGVHEFMRLGNFLLAYFLHPNGTTASISIGREVSTELAAEYPDGRAFYVRDSAPPRGLTPPPWLTCLFEPGKSVAQITSIFNARRPPGHRIEGEAYAVAHLADGFNRIQQWRVDRGGWNRAEVQEQMGIADPSGHEEQIDDQCFNVREKWLFAWFKDLYPEQAEGLLKTLVIVHDDLDESVLWFLWVLGGGTARVPKREFENMPAREAFRRINESQGQPMRLVAQKTSGYLADFYVP